VITPLLTLPALALAFPQIDPIAIEIGPLAIRWYALAYIVGILLGWWYARRLAARPDSQASAQMVDDTVFWATLGILVGGRLGLVLFYEPSFFLANPLEILKVWQGGMSFHGGLIGVAAAIGIVAWRHKVSYFVISDLVGIVTPIGLFFGRIANFINGELWGRVSDVPWAMVFPDPRAGGLPRHPSQLYQAFGEGFVLFFIMMAFWRMGWLAKPGKCSAGFCVAYGTIRFIDEFWRQYDPELGLILGMTQGQLLSIPMILLGLFVFWWLGRKGDPPPAASDRA